MSHDLDQFPVNFSGQVRLFPLPNLVLFPGCVQPLHIFESRYREMLTDAVQDDSLLAIATLLPGYEVDYHSRPPIADHVCVGNVVTHEKTAKGTYNLVLVGARRAAVQNEITPVRSYRRAHVKIIDDVVVTDTPAAQQLGQQLGQQIGAIGQGAQKLAAAFRQDKISLAAFTDLIAFHFPLPLDVKLQLLADADPSHRAQMLIEAIKLEPSTKIDQSAGATDDDQPPAARRRFPPQFGEN